MKTFQQLNNELNLKESIGSNFGTLYFISDLPFEKIFMVRHLDGKLTIDLLPVYVRLYNAIMQTINCNATLSEHVFIPNFIEIGKDYFIRPFYIYYKSTKSYYDEDEPTPAPDEYPILIDALTRELAKFNESTDIVYRVLKRSLLEPSGKTIVDNIWNKLIIVEPKITIADLEEWRDGNG